MTLSLQHPSSSTLHLLISPLNLCPYTHYYSVLSQIPQKSQIRPQMIIIFSAQKSILAHISLSSVRTCSPPGNGLGTKGSNSVEGGITKAITRSQAKVLHDLHLMLRRCIYLEMSKKKLTRIKLLEIKCESIKDGTTLILGFV